MHYRPFQFSGLISPDIKHMRHRMLFLKFLMQVPFPLYVEQYQTGKQCEEEVKVE